MKPRPVHVVLALIGTFLVACGDDDEPLSKREYLAKGNAICAESQAKFNRLFETDFPATQGAVPNFFRRATPIYEKQISDLRALDGPEADKTKIKALLAVGDRAAADFERARKDPKYGARLFSEEGGRNASEFDKRAQAYGLKSCGEDEEEGEQEAKQEAKTDPSTFSAEKRAYIKEADAVCRRSNAEFSRLEERYLKSFPPPLETWARFLPGVVEVARASLADLKRITPPDADKETIDDLLARQERLLDDFEQAATAAAAKDEDRFLKLSQKAFPAGDEIDADLRAYGFEACGAEEGGD